MNYRLTRRALMGAAAAMAVSISAFGTFTAEAADKIQLRLSAVQSETDQRSVAMIEKFAPMVSEFASFEPHWNGSLFKQGTELEAIARGNLEMSITSAQEMATFFPEWSIFTAGYVLQSAEHQVKVFNDPVMDPFKQKAEAELGVKLLAPMYLGRRQVNLRFPRSEKDIKTPADLAGVNLRMPGSDAWQFLGKALGASPTPMAFTEIYTALQTGAVDGQDNPLPTVVDAKFFEVTKQIALTSHLVDWNFIAISKKAFDAMTPEQQAKVTEAAVAAADFGRANQLKKEEDLVSFLKEKGLDVYEPDVAAFRTTVQKAYMDSDFAKAWPAGALEKINALGN